MSWYLHGNIWSNVSKNSATHKKRETGYTVYANNQYFGLQAVNDHGNKWENSNYEYYISNKHFTARLVCVELLNFGLQFEKGFGKW